MWAYTSKLYTASSAATACSGNIAHRAAWKVCPCLMMLYIPKSVLLHHHGRKENQRTDHSTRPYFCVNVGAVRTPKARSHNSEALSGLLHLVVLCGRRPVVRHRWGRNELHTACHVQQLRPYYIGVSCSLVEGPYNFSQDGLHVNGCRYTLQNQCIETALHMQHRSGTGHWVHSSGGSRPCLMGTWQ